LLKTKYIETLYQCLYDLIPKVFFLDTTRFNVLNVWFAMKKFLLILAGASSLALSSSHALASDKILSPVSEWNVEKLKAVGSRSACLVFTQYEDGVSLSLEALQSQLSALRLSDVSGGFASGQALSVTLGITPSYSAVKSAQAVSENELVIDAANDLELLKAIQQGFIINIQVGERSYGLSLSGAVEGIRRLLTCRDTNWRASRRVYDSPDTQDVASFGSPAMPLNIYAYPLDADKTAEIQDAPAQVQLSEQAPVSAVEIENKSLPQITANEFVVETETTEISEQRGDVIDLSNTDQQQIVMEPINTVTRVHTPKVKIQPRGQGGSEEVVDIAVPVRGTDDLVKPPAFDDSLLRQGQEMLEAENQNGQMPFPERNPNARLSSAEESVTRLARKNDTEHEILVSDNAVPERNENAILSQGPDGIYTRPVVISRIPEADLPSRIDITNRDVSANVDVEAENYASRSVSNQELEYELKRLEAPDESAYDDQSEVGELISETAAPVPSMPSVQKTPAKWNAASGDNLRETLAKWSLEEGVELIWDSELQYDILSPVNMNASFEKAVSHVLNHYMVAPDMDTRPVGQLYVDPQSGSKVLIIQADQG